MNGELGILNVGAGDTKISFNPDNPEDVKRSSMIVEDMLRRGFALLIEAGVDDDGEPLFRRAKAFDPKTCEYIIEGFPESADEKAEETPVEKAKVAPKKRGRPRKTARVPAAKARGTAVAPSAGG